MMRAQQPGKAPSKKQRAQTLFQQGQLKQARAIYEKLCKENPRDAECHYMLGSIAGQLRKYDEAAAHFKKTLELQPNTFIAYCGLGAALKEAGRHSEAEGAFRNALRLKPGFVDVQLELAGTLLSQEKFGEAQALLEQIVASHPDSASAQHGLGQIHHVRRDLERAMSYYQQALGLDPNRADTHNRLGFVLHTLGRPQEAVVHFRKAVSLDPNFVDAHKNMGSSLLTAGQLDEAQKALETALKLAPENPNIIVSLAAVLERRNDHQGAYDKLSPLLEKGIRHPGLGITFADICRKVDRCNEASAYLEELVLDKTFPEGTREQMHFALGKLYDKLGRYDDAFGHFKAANDLHPDRFSAAEHFATVAAIIDTFDRQFLASAPKAAIQSDRPIFIVGMPRSGTSLTEQILARHPAVFAAGELLDIGDHAARLAHILAPPGFPNCLRKITQSMLDQTAQAYLDHLSQINPASRFVTDKMPQNFLYLGLIALLFPRARVIHCMRDPRDTCLSIYFQHFNEAHSYATDLKNLGAYYSAYERLMHHWRTVLDIPILDLHYEDMVEKQEETTRQLLDFLGLDWEPRCLDFHEAGRFVATSSYDQVRQPIYKKSVARWKHYERHIGPLLETLG